MSAVVVVKPGTVVSTIQAGVDVAAPGDTVLVRAGVFHESVVVPPGKPLTIRGKGKVVVDGRGPGGVPLGPGILYLANGGGVSGLRFRHQAWAGPGQVGRGIDYQPAVPSAPFQIDRCEFEHCIDGAVFAAGVQVSVRRCKVRDVENARSITLTGPQARLERCEVAAGVGVGVFGSDAVVRQNVVRDVFGAEGILVEGLAPTVEKNAIVGVGWVGMRVLGVQATVRGNRIEHSLERGLSVVGDEALVESNRISHATNIGIEIVGSATTVRKNLVREVAAGSLVDIRGGIAAFGTDALFTANSISDCVVPGMRLDLDHSDILGNVVRRCGAASQYGIRITGANLNVAKNLVAQSRADGFWFEGVLTTFTANRAVGCARDGFDLTGQDLIVEKNVALGNSGEGFDLGVLALTFRQNVAKGNRLDLASTIAIATFESNSYGSGGPTQVPEIE